MNAVTRGGWGLKTIRYVVALVERPLRSARHRSNASIRPAMASNTIFGGKSVLNGGRGSDGGTGGVGGVLRGVSHRFVRRTGKKRKRVGGRCLQMGNFYDERAKLSGLAAEWGVGGSRRCRAGLRVHIAVSAAVCRSSKATLYRKFLKKAERRAWPPIGLRKASGGCAGTWAGAWEQKKKLVERSRTIDPGSLSAFVRRNLDRTNSPAAVVSCQHFWLKVSVSSVW